MELGDNIRGDIKAAPILRIRKVSLLILGTAFAVRLIGRVQIHVFFKREGELTKSRIRGFVVLLHANETHAERIPIREGYVEDSVVFFKTFDLSNFHGSGVRQPLGTTAIPTGSPFMFW